MTSDLIFPELATNFSATLSILKRSTLSIHNRINSILDDAEFACAVADAYSLPLVANERCGSWYIPPERKDGSAYFKSTDGHMGQWSFSNRRLNLQILDLIASKKGCIIVDSTRRGKSMPDALSKTVPIWCNVMNRILFPDSSDLHELFVPPNVVSDSEKSQISSRLHGFVQQFKDLEIDLSSYKPAIKKPLRPIWITRDSSLPIDPPIFTDFHPILLCTASRRVAGAEMSEGGYIQGAGDDSEGWSHGLTPGIFWKYKQRLLQTSESALPELIASLVQQEKKIPSNMSFTRIGSCPQLHIGRTDDFKSQSFEVGDALIWCDVDFDSLGHITFDEGTQGIASTTPKPRYLPLLHLCTKTGKLGARDLRTELNKLIPFFQSLRIIKSIYVCCPDGRDISIGVSLAILCLFSTTEASDKGLIVDKQLSHKTVTKIKSVVQISKDKTERNVDKQYIRQELAKLMLSIPNTNPSRATLQSINTFIFNVAGNISPNLSHGISVKSEFTIKDLFSALPGRYRMRKTIISNLDSSSANEQAVEAFIETSPGPPSEESIKGLLNCYQIGIHTGSLQERASTSVMTLERRDIDSSDTGMPCEEYCITLSQSGELQQRLWIDKLENLGDHKLALFSESSAFCKETGFFFQTSWRFLYFRAAENVSNELYVQNFTMKSRLWKQKEEFCEEFEYIRMNDDVIALVT